MKHSILLEIGTALKKQRRASKVSIEQVSKELKIRKSYLKAIESGSKSLKFDAYTIGYVKQYAMLLGMNPAPYVELLNKNISGKKVTSGKSNDLITGLEFLPSQKLVLVALILLVFCYLIVALIY